MTEGDPVVQYDFEPSAEPKISVGNEIVVVVVLVGNIHVMRIFPLVSEQKIVPSDAALQIDSGRCLQNHRRHLVGAAAEHVVVMQGRCCQPEREPGKFWQQVSTLPGRRFHRHDNVVANVFGELIAQAQSDPFAHGREAGGGYA